MEVGIRNDLVFGTVSANDFGIYISGEGVYNAPERVVELLDVPGRNGALTIDKGHYDNITIEYPAFTFADSQAEFRRKFNAYKNAIMAQVGYQKLTDTYHPDEYRLGMFVEGLEVSPVGYGRSGSFTLKFNCKPQRYLVDGQQAITVEDEDIVVNPTLYESSPLLMVEGYGTIGFNGYEIELEDAQVGNLDMWSAEEGSCLIATKTYTGSATTYNYPTAVDTMTLTDGALMDRGDVFNFTVEWSLDGTTAINANATVSNTFSTTTATDTNKGTTTTYSDDYNVSSVSSEPDIVVTLNVGFLYGYNQSISMTTTVTGSNNKNLTLWTYVSYRGGAGNQFVEIQHKINYLGSDALLPWTTHTPTSQMTISTAYLDYSISKAVGTSTLSLLGNPTYIDCELGECYLYNDGEMASLNGYVDLGSDLPKLASGNNTFDVDNTVTELQLVPRWWEL